MPQTPITLIRVTLHIRDGKPVFEPDPGETGYQFTRKVTRGVMVFTLASKEYLFCGCSFHPNQGDMPGVDARWGDACRNRNELVVTFDFPNGRLHEGDLHLGYMHRDLHTTGIADPQVGNDGQTGGQGDPDREDERED